MAGDETQPGEVIVGAADLRARVQELGASIAHDYAGLDPLLIGVLKGAFVFMADLIRAIPMPVEVDFMACASYGSSTRSSGVVRIVKDLDLDLAGRHVADRRGHHRLRPHAVVPAQDAVGPQPGEPRGLRPPGARERAPGRYRVLRYVGLHDPA